VTAVSALSNTSQRSVYNYRRVGRYFALGNTCHVQLFLVIIIIIIIIVIVIVIVVVVL